MKSVREYLEHKPCLRGQILDRGELKRVAQACKLSPQDTRSELRRLGFILTKNNHGLTIWTRGEEDLIGATREEGEFYFKLDRIERHQEDLSHR